MAKTTLAIERGMLRKIDDLASEHTRLFPDHAGAVHCNCEMAHKIQVLISERLQLAETRKLKTQEGDCDDRRNQECK